MAISANVKKYDGERWVVNERLSKKMKQLSNADIYAINSFLMQFLKYADETLMSEDDIWRTLDLVECYLARRIICSMSTQSLGNLFCVLHRDVQRSMREYEQAGQPLNVSYYDILVYHILRRNGTWQMPGDDEFVEAIHTCDVYSKKKTAQRFLFERLENFNHTEFTDVSKLMQEGEATIEHIMPRTLTPHWLSELGADAEEIHRKYLNTFANLTLTGVNSELSNKSFVEKKEGRLEKGLRVNGYEGSIYRLTRDLVKYSSWRLEDMQHRAKEIETKFLALYPFPETTFKPMPKRTNEVSLDDENFDPAGVVLQGYRLFGVEYKQTYWRTMLILVIRVLYQHYPDVLDDMAQKNNRWIFNTKDRRTRLSKIADNCYITTDLNNRNKLKLLRDIFDELNVSYSELVFLIDPERRVAAGAEMEENEEEHDE